MDVRLDSTAAENLIYVAGRLRVNECTALINAMSLYFYVVGELLDKNVDNAVLALVPRDSVQSGKIINVPGVDLRL